MIPRIERLIDSEWDIKTNACVCVLKVYVFRMERIQYLNGTSKQAAKKKVLKYIGCDSGVRFPIATTQNKTMFHFHFDLKCVGFDE